MRFTTRGQQKRFDLVSESVQSDFLTGENDTRIKTCVPVGFFSSRSDSTELKMSEKFIASILHLHAESKRARANRIVSACTSLPSPDPHLSPITASASSNFAVLDSGCTGPDPSDPQFVTPSLFYDPGFAYFFLPFLSEGKTSGT